MTSFLINRVLSEYTTVDSHPWQYKTRYVSRYLREMIFIMCLERLSITLVFCFFFFQAEDGIRDYKVTGVQTCALPISCNLLLQGDMRRNPGNRGLTSLRTVRRISAQYASTPSQGTAMRTILAAAELLRASSCAVVSAATTNITASWIVKLLRPVYREHFDFVAPVFARDKYQGLLARELLYPMSRAVFGYGIRELYAEEWGFSGRLASECLEQNVWQEEAVRARPEAWMAVTAMCADFKCCPTFLGPKAPLASATGPDIVEAVRP